jgi:SAM-dependent methyltransferase
VSVNNTLPNKNSDNNEKKQVSFDDYIDSYKSEVQSSIGFIGQEVDFFLDIKAELLVKLAEKNFGKTEDLKVLDIGSGIGLVDKLIKSRIKNLYGVDVEDGVVEQAIKNNPDVNYQKYDGENLPFEENTFDITFAINVMHHVPPALWENFSKETYRVLKPGGIGVIFEHNPFNPLTRKVVRDCEFDRDAVLLSHKKIKELFTNASLKVDDNAYIIFFPFKGKMFRWIESGLKWLPLGAQQYVTARK